MTYLIITQPGGFSPGDSPHLAPHLKQIWTSMPCYVLSSINSSQRPLKFYPIWGRNDTAGKKIPNLTFPPKKTPFLRQFCPARNMLTCHRGLCSRPLPTLASHSICTSCPGKERCQHTKYFHGTHWMWLSQHPHLKLKNWDSLLSSKVHKGDLPVSQCWGTLALKSHKVWSCLWWWWWW